MLMMGLKQWILWSSWFLKQFLFLLISVVIMSILIKASSWACEMCKFAFKIEMISSSSATWPVSCYEKNSDIKVLAVALFIDGSAHPAVPCPHDLSASLTARSLDHIAGVNLFLTPPVSLALSLLLVMR
jgi:hypothetical protein